MMMMIIIIIYHGHNILSHAKLGVKAFAASAASTYKTA